MRTDSTVEFGDGTTTNYTTLDGFITYHSCYSDSTIWESGAYDVNHTFTGYNVLVSCDHIFTDCAGTGANLTFETSAFQV